MQQTIDPQTAILRYRHSFFRKHPGLEIFLRREKAFLQALLLLVIFNKLSVLFLMSGQFTLGGVFGILLGILIPLVLAFAIYSGRWRFSYLLFLFGGYLAVDLFLFARSTLPLLSTGLRMLVGSPFWLGCMVLSEACCMVLSFFLAGWLTFSRKNQRHAEAARRLNIECGDLANRALHE